MDTLKIKSAEVVLTNGMDEVRLITNLPHPVPQAPGADQTQMLVVSFMAEKDQGVEYVETHFTMRPKTISRRF